MSPTLPEKTVESESPVRRLGQGRWLRVLLTVIAVLFLTLFVLVPACNVFAQALRNGIGAYVAVFIPPAANEARLTAIRTRLNEIDQLSFAERRKLRDEQRALQKEESEIVGPAEKARKNWSAVRMTLGIAAYVVPLNMLFGVAAAWAVTKFHFRGRSLLVSLIDLPFSVSPVIAGLIFVLLFGQQGFLSVWSQSQQVTWLSSSVRALPWAIVASLGVWLGSGLVVWMMQLYGSDRGRGWRFSRIVASLFVLLFIIVWGSIAHRVTDWTWLKPTEWTWPDPTSIYWRGFKNNWWPFASRHHFTGVIFTPLAIVMASIFVTFPFVARSLIPLMETQGVEAEQAALTLGAGGWYTFRRVTIPQIKWGLLYGAILCTARALGEFGAVSVVSGHLDSNDTMPLRVEKLWQEYRTQPAFTVASLLAMLAVLTLVIKSFIEWKTSRDRVDI